MTELIVSVDQSEAKEQIAAPLVDDASKAIASPTTDGKRNSLSIVPPGSRPTSALRTPGSKSVGNSKMPSGSKSAKAKKKAKIVEDVTVLRRLCLHAATNSVEAVRHLLSAEGEPRYDWEAGGNELLCIAAERGFGEIVQLCIELGANVNACSGRALQRACAAGRIDSAATLLSAGADPALPALFTGFTALMCVAMMDLTHSNVAIQPTSSSSSQTTIAAVPELLPSSEHVANESSPSPTHHQLPQLNSGLSLVHISASSPPITSRTKFLSPRSSVQTAVPGSPNHTLAQSPLLAPTTESPTHMNSAVKLMKLLLSYPAVQDTLNVACSHIHCAEYNDWTALHFASDRGQTELVRLLLEAGANIEVANTRGETALSIAAELGHCDVVRLLVNEGAKVNVKRRTMSVVDWCLYRGEYELVEFLVSHGAKPGLDSKPSWLNASLNEVLVLEFSESLYDELQLAIYRGGEVWKQREAISDKLINLCWETDLVSARRAAILEESSPISSPKSPTGKKAASSTLAYLPFSAVQLIVGYTV